MKKSEQAKATRLDRRGIPDKYKVFLFALPFILYCFIASYLPLWGWSYAFVTYRPGRALLDSPWRGLKNFTDIFGNPVLLKQIMGALKNTLGIQALSYLIMPLPMLFAIFLSEVRSKKFQKFVQTVTTLPHFISWVIMFSLAMALLGNRGLVNILLERLGKEPINVLYTTKNVWITQVALAFWKGLGWNSIVYFAAIAGIDQEQYEAAMVDGASRMQKIWYITIPNLMPTFVVLLVISIGSFLSTGLEQFQVFSNAMNLDKIQTLDLYVYNLGLGGGKLSYGVAVGILTSIVAIILVSFANWFSKKVRGTSVF